MGESDWDKYQNMKPIFKHMIEASTEIEKLDFFTRKVAGEIRNTIHFKLK